MANTVKLLIIDASVVVRRTISIKLINDSSLQLVSAVCSIPDATDKIKFFKPDVIVLGIDKIDAATLRAYETFIKLTGLPLVIITNESASLLHLVREVKIEFVARPPLADMNLVETASAEVLQKLRKLMNLPGGTPVTPEVNLVSGAGASARASAEIEKPKFGEKSVYQIQGKNIIKPQLTSSRYGGMVLAMGSSTGGTEALYAVLTKLPQDMPPILIVQHMPPVFTRLYGERLNLNCKFEVREAQNGDALYPGLALIAPGDRQMCLVRRGGKLAVECVRTDKVSGHCPSVDLMFESVAATMGKNAVGVIMTGMGKDGAQGMLRMHGRGAYTIGQNEASCVVYGMPKVAYELGAVDIQSNLEKMPELLLRAIRDKAK